MAKSMCNGCKHWKRLGFGFNNGSFFHCAQFFVWEIDKRRQLCNGKYYEPKKELS